MPEQQQQQPQQKKKTLRILLCAENYPPQINGIARRVKEYEDGLKQQGHHVDVLSPYSKDETWCCPHPWNENADLMLIRPLALYKYVESHQNYDVIHVVMPLNLSGGWIMAMSKILRSMAIRFDNNTKYPALVISHHLNGEQYINTYSPPIIRDFQKFLIFNCLSSVLPLLCDRILAPTLSTEPRLLSQFPNEMVGVCSTGISSEFSPRQTTNHTQEWMSQKQEFLERTGKKYLLLFVGRLAPEKGVHRLLAAMEQQLHQNCALWIVGDGPYRPTAETLARKHGIAVQFLGYQRDAKLASVYSVADCFVCPSHTETYGQVVQEAIATGVRVALPAIPAFVEAFESVVGAKAYWRPNDTTSMVATIQNQVELPPRSMQERLAVYEQLMTWTQACDSLLTQYEHATRVMKKEEGTKMSSVGIAATILWIVFSFLVYVSGHLVYFLYDLVEKRFRLPKFFYVEGDDTNGGFFHLLRSSGSARTSYPFLNEMFWEFYRVQDNVTEYMKLKDNDEIAYHDFEHMIVTNCGQPVWDIYAFIRDRTPGGVGRSHILDPLCRFVSRKVWPSALDHTHHVFIDMLVIGVLHPDVMVVLADKVLQLEFLESKKLNGSDNAPIHFPKRYTDDQIFSATSSSGNVPGIIFAKSRYGAYGEHAQVLVKKKLVECSSAQHWRIETEFISHDNDDGQGQDGCADPSTDCWSSKRMSFHMYEEYLRNHPALQRQLIDAGIINQTYKNSAHAPLVTFRVWSNRYRYPSRESHVAALLVGSPKSLCSNVRNNQCIRILVEHGQGYVKTKAGESVEMPRYPDLIACARWVHGQFPQLPFLAFDFALTKDGFVFLEANPMCSYSKYPSLFETGCIYSLEDCESWLKTTMKSVLEDSGLEDRCGKDPGTKPLLQLSKKVLAMPTPDKIALVAKASTDTDSTARSSSETEDDSL